MHKLATRKDMLHNVDWLTEVVRRASAAYIGRKDLETVNMRAPMRLEKVSGFVSLSSKRSLTFFIPVEKARDTLHGSRME